MDFHWLSGVLHHESQRALMGQYAGCGAGFDGLERLFSLIFVDFRRFSLIFIDLRVT